MRDLHEHLAHLELFDSWLPSDAADERQKIYNEIVPFCDDPIDQAYRVFDIVSQQATGLAASVADQRLAQLEITENVETYAALGGMSVASILDLHGWWAPNWAWMQTLERLSPTPPEKTDDLEHLAAHWAPVLLRAGAETLAGFYGRVAAGAGRLLRLRYRLVTPRSVDRATIAVTISVLEERKRLFLVGPGEDGHYLRREHADEEIARRAIQELHAVAERIQFDPFRRRNAVAE